ncbi:glycosyltransferase family 2 protein [Massilia sp. PWRC2]|uniref:glycosyltransferase family 2 protein n=1 Tax=Massilia sp. PWRC2 TaxID=2804626 RepID=UPI003CF6916D
MTTVVIPLAARSDYFPLAQYPHPLPLTEVMRLPMIQYVIENLRRLEATVQFVFIVLKDDCSRFHLDRSLKLLADGAQVVILENMTQGALCSCLMAIEHIDHAQPLIIANGDQYLDIDVATLLPEFVADAADAACLYFRAVTPRWSYVKVEGQQVVEAAEKKPISRHAVAGFYYFRSGALFLDAASRSILQRTTEDGRYFIAPVLNQLIIDNRRVYAREISNDAYFSFYTPQRIEEFEQRHGQRVAALVDGKGGS